MFLKCYQLLLIISFLWGTLAIYEARWRVCVRQSFFT
jgi:hypothetical protein